MVDKPRRPILHLKFPTSSPAEPKPSSPDDAAAAPAAASARPAPLAPAGRLARTTVREFTPARTARPPRPPRAVETVAPKPKTFAWKCKPCGKGLDVAPELADDESVRCPNCNARLGLARDFRSDPPNLEKVRARMTGKD